MGNVQPHSLQPGLVAASQSSDHTAPTSRITAPSNNASDGGGGVVAGVEVSVDGGTTWHPATGSNNWTYSWTVPSNTGSVRIRGRATDDSGNIESPSSGILVQVVQTHTVQGPPQLPSGPGNDLNNAMLAFIEGIRPVVSASTTRLVLTAQPTSDGSGRIVTVRVVDAHGNRVIDYRGALTLSSDDPGSGDLGGHTVTEDDHGVFAFLPPSFSHRHTHVTATDGHLTGFVDVDD
jgi:hypothetical protein